MGRRNRKSGSGHGSSRAFGDGGGSGGSGSGSKSTMTSKARASAKKSREKKSGRRKRRKEARDVTVGSRPSSPMEKAWVGHWKDSWHYGILKKHTNIDEARTEGRESTEREFREMVRGIVPIAEERRLLPLVDENPVGVAETCVRYVREYSQRANKRDVIRKVRNNIATYKARMRLTADSGTFYTSMIPGWVISQWDRWGRHSFYLAKDLSQELSELPPRRLEPLPTLDFPVQHVWLRLPYEGTEYDVSVTMLRGGANETESMGGDPSLLFLFVFEDQEGLEPYVSFVMRESEWNDPLYKMQRFVNYVEAGDGSLEMQTTLGGNLAKDALRVVMNFLYCMQDTLHVEREVKRPKERGEFAEKEAGKQGKTFNPLTVVKIHAGMQKRIVDVWPQRPDTGTGRKIERAHWVRKHEKTYWILAKNVKPGEKTYGTKTVKGKKRVAIKRELSVFPRCGIPDEEYERTTVAIPTKEDLT